MRLKSKDIPVLRDRIIAEQGGKCWICEIDLSTVKACLDHDHFTGRIRSVLCQNCNGIEGKIKNLSNRGKRDKTRYDFLNKILSYWNFHSANQRQEFHPTHKTEDEKRLRRNKKARERRKRLAQE
jgi:hypothetical protein